MKMVFDEIREESLYYSEIRVTILLWIYTTQHRQFSDVFNAIRKEEIIFLQRQLGSRIDEFGILRCHGCFQNVDIPEGAKCPKLIASGEHFT